MKYRLSIDASQDLVDYLRDRINLDLTGQNLDGPNWFCVTVRDAMGQVVAGAACEFKTPFDASFSVAVDKPQAITRKLLHGLFMALFSQAKRVTALVDPANGHAEKCVRRMGFVYEGFLRRGLDGERDALLYGMLREDCRYLGVRATATGGVTDGQSAQVARPLRHGSGATERQRGVGSGQRYH